MNALMALKRVRQLAPVRYGAGLLVSAVFNLGLVISLAELGRPPLPDDDHDAHRVRPSVVEPPPEATPETPVAPQSAATPLPSSPVAPTLDLPNLGDVGDGPALDWGDLDDVGLTGFDGLGLTAAPSPDVESTAPDEPPQVTVPPDLARFYPQAARRRGIGGRSIVAVDVDVQGRVTRAEVLRSDPPALFDDAAIRAARAFRFLPAKKRGKPVPARTRLELRWQPRS